MNETSFKQRVRNELIAGANIYKSTFIDYEYLIYGDGFKAQQYYIIGAYENNYQHLTGVGSDLTADIFFQKCLDGTLQEADFGFIRKDQCEKSVKGSVRRKIKLLPSLSTIFSNDLQAEESFTKNNIRCSLATADNRMTIGFIYTNKAIPKTLLAGNELNPKNIVDVSVVLRRNRNADKFDEIIKGDANNFQLLLSGALEIEESLVERLESEESTQKLTTKPTSSK